MQALPTLAIVCVVVLAGGFASHSAAQAPAGEASDESKGVKRDPIQSPAALPRPRVAAKQSYSDMEVQAGETRFVSQCGFCHGRDAAGGESGPDLTRSELVAQDNRGDKIGPVVRTGRVDAGMPGFSLSAEELNGVVAFIHSQMDKFSTQAGGRRTVDPSDLATGNVADGRAYFNGGGGCSRCHSPTGDLAHVATRYKGLTLLQRMLYPSGRPAPAPAKAIFTLKSGQTVVAPVTAEDEFSVTVTDPLGKPQTYQKTEVNVKIDNPMQAHYTQLGKYTDATMHNVYAYLDTLR